MSEEFEKLISMIKQNKSVNEICKMLRISPKQLAIKLNMLKMQGYYTDKDYDMNGMTFLKIENPFETEKTIEIEDYNSKPKKNVRFVAISDTHLGNKLDDLNYINALYNYCIKNNVHIILNAGDLCEGIYPDKHEATTKNSQEQLDYVLKNYPYDKGILNFLTLGNHDASFYYQEGIDIKKFLENRRLDIIPIGYGYGKLNLANCPIIMQHKIERAGLEMPFEEGLVLKGHAHKYRTTPSKNGNLTIYVPSLSNVVPGNDGIHTPLPALLDIKLEVNDLFIKQEYIQYFIYINGEFVRASELNEDKQIPIVKSRKKEEKL